MTEIIRQIKPMAAYKPKDGPYGKVVQDVLNNTSGQWIFDEKKDGSRYLSHFFKGKTVYTGRAISEVTHAFTQTVGGKLSHINFDIPELYGTIADGEYMGTSAASMKQHYYCIFDVLYYKGESLMDRPLSHRNAYKQRVVDEILTINPEAKVEVLSQYPIELAAEFFERIVKEGGEGLVLKNLDSLYLPGTRSRFAWIKMKKNETFDVIITGYASSDSDKYGPAGLNTFKHLMASQYNNTGELVEVTHIPATSFTDEQHLQIKVAGVQSLIGKIAEVGGMERASKGIKIRHPRFIRWRIDKNREDCKAE